MSGQSLLVRPGVEPRIGKRFLTVEGIIKENIGLRQSTQRCPFVEGRDLRSLLQCSLRFRYYDAERKPLELILGEGLIKSGSAPPPTLFQW